jgi:hypothetical protein
LGREHAGRRAAYARFRESWETYARDGMRRELVALSVAPPSKQLENARSDSLT